MITIRITPKQFVTRGAAAHAGWENGLREIVSLVARGDFTFACPLTGAHLAVQPTPSGRWWSVSISGYTPDLRDERRCAEILSKPSL